MILASWKEGDINAKEYYFDYANSLTYLGCNGIDLIYEENAGCTLSCLFEQLSEGSSRRMC
jgi:hypothetical protein